jgi:hypothetical protein
MSIRSVKFVPALLAGVVAGGNLATTTDLRAQVLTTSAEAAIQAPQVAADSCLSAPKGATPAGSHWYYRLDRVTKRQCWYLREESDAAEDKFTRAAPPASAPASAATADEPAPQPRTAGRRSISDKSISDKSISDARAEWHPRVEPNPPARVERTAATAAPAPVVSNSPRTAMPNVLAPSPLSSMRWNEASPTGASADPTDIRLAAATPPAAQLPQVEEVRQPAINQVVPTASADAAPAKPTASLQKLLMVMAAALALAGLTVSAIVRIGRMRARRAMRRKRRAMWDSAKTANKTAKTRRRAPQQQPQPQPTFRDEDAVVRRAAAAQQHARVQQERAPTRPPRERPRTPAERPYAPQERRHAPQDRVPQERMPQDRLPQDRLPQDRVPHDRDRERQVTEMLSRLARTAQS